MDRFWLKNYPPGVPADIDPSLYPSVVALLEESFIRYRAADAYVCMDKALTFGRLNELSRALAAWLQGRGLKRGARVAIMMPNVLQYPVAVAAVLRAGFIAVNVNPLYSARELAHQLEDSGAEAVIVLENFAATLETAMAAGTAVKHVIVGTLGDLLGFPKGLIVNLVVRHLRKLVKPFALPGHVAFNDAIAEGRTMKLERPNLGPDDVAVLQYTGGTTGPAKGATLLHHTLVANLLASEAWMQPGLKRKKPGGQVTIVCALPLYHVFAFVTCGLLGMRTGALNILIPDPRDLKSTIRELAKYHINIFPGVNTLFNGLLQRPEFAKLDFSGLAITNGGGMAVQEVVAKNWLAVTGCPIVEGYGLSETSAGVTCNRTDSEAFTGTIGLPLPNVEIRILDNDGQRRAARPAGRDRDQGPAGHAGLLAAARRDGACHDTGRLLQVGRHRRHGRTGLREDRGSQEGHDHRLGLQGVPQRDRGGGRGFPRRPRMRGGRRAGRTFGRGGHAVRGKKDPSLTREALVAFCARELTAYKRPKYIEFRTVLPKTNVGKILRRELRDEVEKKAA